MPDLYLGYCAPAAGLGASIYLASDFPFTGDCWSGANALGFVVYKVAPAYDASGSQASCAIWPADASSARALPYTILIAAA